jgi:hypothetical protein
LNNATRINRYGGHVKTIYGAFNQGFMMLLPWSLAFKKFRIGMKIWLCSAFGIANKKGKVVI